MSTKNFTAHSSTWQVAVENQNDFIITNRGPGKLQYTFNGSLPSPGFKGHLLDAGENMERNGNTGSLYVKGVSGDCAVVISYADYPYVKDPEAAHNYGNRYHLELLSGSIAAAGTYDIHMTIGDYPVHIESAFTRKLDGPYKVQIYEGATITTSTDKVPAQLNRQSSKAISGTYGVATAVSDTGTLLLTINHIENTSLKVSFEGHFDDSLIFSPNTTYLFRFTNNDNSAHQFAITHIFQEIKP